MTPVRGAVALLIDPAHRDLPQHSMPLSAAKGRRRASRRIASW